MVGGDAARGKIRGWLIEDGMSVGSTKAKAIDADSSTTLDRPLDQICGNLRYLSAWIRSNMYEWIKSYLYFPVLKVDVGVPLLKVDVRGYLALFGGKNAFDQASDPGGSLKMTNVCLHRAYKHWVLDRPSVTQSLRDGLQFPEVTSLGSSSVTLDESRLVHVQVVLGVERSDVGNLGLLARKSDAL